ncbi:MAG TPA: amylo-alpha-1,6-glucosidase [Candidatus Cybelea sp.]|nr:amylo-alpha-1,6-glucosidase [Candidatus Cybelea sp.]
MIDGGDPPIAFGRSVCGELDEAEQREWLVTNGLGGYASGTIAGTLTRRYHGLLVAALKPPLERTLLVTKFDETATYRGESYALATNRWKDEHLAPRGFELIERFYLDGSTPVWEYALADALLEKRIWMSPGSNVTSVRYSALRAAEPIAVNLLALANYRDFHGNTHAGDWAVSVVPIAGGVTVTAYDTATPFSIVTERSEVTIENVWYRDFVLVQETARGLDDRDDHLGVARFAFTLLPGESVTLTSGICDAHSPCHPERSERSERSRRAERSASPCHPERSERRERSRGAEGEWIDQLERAAEQFVVARPTASDPDGRTIIAGYHWFGDWGRDTMIALPGLTLATGRPEIARKILTAFAPFVDGGMLPNFFPEAGQSPEYNTADAALWYVEAAAAYVDSTADRATLRELWSSLRDVIAYYRDGTRYGIHMDADGTIVASAPGVQLTWMDAKIGDWVVTPRMGKPVEIAALWYNALERMTALAALLGEPAHEYAALAKQARLGFQRFYNAQTGGCYDVIDGPGGNDASLRPNQLFAVSLPHSPLEVARQRAVVDICAAELVTSNGLRTLAPSDPKFIAHYGGSPHDRDAAYHQGTVWPWLLGPFAIAHARVYHDTARARSFLEPLADRLRDGGLGSISEIADGGAPFRPNGAIAQAWSVAELIRAWKEVARIG